MHAGSIEKTVEPALLARHNERLQAHVDVASMTRLTGLLADDSGTVVVDLAFHEDSGRRAVITGSVSARVNLTCQRCMEPLVQDLNAEVHAAAVRDEEQAEALPEELDPVLCERGELVLLHLVQDELLLALPVIARHEDHPSCRPYTADAPGGDGATRDNPFADLAQLKGQLGSGETN